MHIAALAQLEQRRQRRPTLWRREDALQRADEARALGNLLLRDRDGAPAALAHGPQDEVIADRCWYPDAAGVRRGMLPRARPLRSLLKGANDGRAALRLYANHPGPLGANPAQRLHLREGFPHAHDARAAARGIDDDIGHLPAKLLRHLVAHRLLPLAAIRLLQR